MATSPSPPRLCERAVLGCRAQGEVPDVPAAAGVQHGVLPVLPQGAGGGAPHGLLLRPLGSRQAAQAPGRHFVLLLNPKPYATLEAPSLSQTGVVQEMGFPCAGSSAACAVSCSLNII